MSGVDVEKNISILAYLFSAALECVVLVKLQGLASHVGVLYDAFCEGVAFSLSGLFFLFSCLLFVRCICPCWRATQFETVFRRNRSITESLPQRCLSLSPMFVAFCLWRGCCHTVTFQQAVRLQEAQVSALASSSEQVLDTGGSLRSCTMALLLSSLVYLVSSRRRTLSCAFASDLLEL